MKFSKNNIIVSCVYVFSFLFFLVSCEDDTLTADKPDQLFRPVNFTAGVSGNVVKFWWVPIAGASYSLELSRDSFLFQNDFQIFQIDGEFEFTIENLWSDSRYSARIKSISKDSSVKDSEYKKITFKTGTENVFFTVSDDNIGTDHVLLKWDISKNVSKIIVSTDGMTDNSFILSASDISAGEKYIDGLTSGTNYIFKIYLGEMLRGKITVKTKS